MMDKKSSRKAAATSGTAITTEQKRLLEKEAETYKKAQLDLAKSAAVLWNAKLDFAIRSGIAERVEEALGSPVGLWDDCNCNQKGCGGGSISGADEIVNPPRM